MGKIIAALDGSVFTNSICQMTAWAADKTASASIALMHVAEPHSEMKVKGDLSGSIGLGANSALLEELVQLDEEHGKCEQKKGQLILDLGKKELAKYTDKTAEIIHRRGSLVEIVSEFEDDAELIVIGKRGEHHFEDKGHMGSNLEELTRSVQKPILIATEKSKPVQKFLLAYDGSPAAKKAVDYVISHSLFNGVDCHLLKVGQPDLDSEALLKEAEDKLKAASINTISVLKHGQSIDKIISDYIQENELDLLVMGAYGHSKIRSLILGSTTKSLICQADVPLLLIR